MIAVGPGARDRDGNTIPVSVKEGDTVLLPEFGGTQVKLGEKEYAYDLFVVIPQRGRHRLTYLTMCVSFDFSAGFFYTGMKISWPLFTIDRIVEERLDLRDFY